MQCRTDSPQYHEPPEAPEWAANAAQERLEERAENEFRSNAKRFRDWLCDQDPLEFAPLIAAAARVMSDSGRQVVDECAQELLLAYKQFRAGDAFEMSLLLRDVIDDAREEA